MESLIGLHRSPLSNFKSQSPWLGNAQHFHLWSPILSDTQQFPSAIARFRLLSFKMAKNYTICSTVVPASHLIIHCLHLHGKMVKSLGFTVGYDAALDGLQMGLIDASPPRRATCLRLRVLSHASL